MDAVLASTIDILEDVKLPDWQSDLAFTEPRFTEPISGLQSIDGSWRLKERVKTVSVALVLCLNVGVDPPDVVKVEPCAHLECWFDPQSDEPQKAIEYISLQLEKQYEQWHSRARYKKCLDPTVDEVKRLCTSLRRYSKEDRVLFHYNGHGVPRPTQNGEIWVFNEKYTQYIPLAIYDLQQWMGAPSIFVYDCSCAGSIVESYQEFARQHRRDYEKELLQYNAYLASQRKQLQQQSNEQIKSSFTTTPVSGTNKSSHDDLSQNTHHLENGSSEPSSNPHTNNNNNNNHHDENSHESKFTHNQTNTSNSAHSNNNGSNQTPAPPQSTTNNTSNPLPFREPLVKPPDYDNCLQFAACEAHQVLPLQPDLPADLFTSCLTTPIKMALRWFIQKNDLRLIPKVTLSLVDKIPGSLSDRRTMLGELNWIFTAITDTIAWDVLPRDLFQRLYRQDLLVASLFRNFLLADRIMRTYDCTPVSHPKLPKTYHHTMWRAWDMVVDLCLSQLVDVIEEKVPFKTSVFFAEQLTAFEVWLDLDHSTNQQPNHQLLPIILQVLLSPVHRLRALDLLSRFLNLGPGAVNSALSVGIFPYVLKLLQSNAREVRPFLLSIWAKILAIDRKCQVDLVRDNYHHYFLTILSDASYDARYRTMAAFVMTCIVRDYPLGQEVACQANLIAFCLEQLDDPDPMLRKWLAICLGTSWDNYEDARWCGVRNCAHEKLYSLLDDHDPEVRTAAVFALGTFINSSLERTDHANTIDHSIGMKLVSTSLYDSSVLVRHELIVALQYLVLAFESQFLKLDQAAKEEERQRHLSPLNALPRVNSLNAIPIVFGSGSKIVSNVYHTIWRAIYTLASDSHPRLASAAQTIIDEIRSRSYSGMSVESLKESKSNSSISESSSPNTATFSVSESPPAKTTTTTYSVYRTSLDTTDSSGATSVLTATSSLQPSCLTNTPPGDLKQRQLQQQLQLNKRSDNYGHHNYQAAPSIAHINRLGVDSSPAKMDSSNQHHHQSTLNHATINHNQANNNNQTTPTTFGNNNSQVPTKQNMDRITKSANVAISKSRRHVTSRDNNNTSEDDNRSNMSSQKPLITSDFVNWCTKYFVDPENNYTSSRASRSKEDQQKEWRMLRVLSYKKVCLRELQLVDPSNFNESVSSYKVQQVPNLIVVHPYDPIMVTASRDEFTIIHSDGSHINNYQHCDLATLNNSISAAPMLGGSSGLAHSYHHYPPHLNQSSYHNNGGDHHHHLHDLIGLQSNCLNIGSSQITSLQLINPHYNTLVCTGSSDGSVQIWRAYNGLDYSFDPHLITAFNLMPELQLHRPDFGMILLWDQNQNNFYATSDQNDVRIIKVWDAASESKVQDIPTCAEYGVTCLTSDGEHSIAAGFLDGSIRIYDTRLKKTDCRTFTFRKHSEKILGLHMYPPGEKHINLVSGDSGGEVRFWDERAPTSVKRVDVGQKMSSMSVHPNSDVFACGLRSGQGIKIYNLDGTSKASCVIKYQDNAFFASRHNPSVSCMAFHPLKTSLVAGYTDAVMSIYSAETNYQ